MKHIKIFEEFKENHLTSLQTDWLRDVVRGVWEVDDDGEITVDGDVMAHSIFHMTEIPVKFKKVMGNFNLRECRTLKGCPQIVEGYFSCKECISLKTLEGAPQEVGWWFSCSGCPSLTTLEGAPQEVGGSFDCDDCSSLISLEGCPTEIGDDFWCRNCPQLRSLSGAPRIKRGHHQFFSNLPKVPMEELELDKNDPSLFQQWAQSGMKIEDFLRQKRGYIKGREFGF